MPTASQYWNPATGLMYLTRTSSPESYINGWFELNAIQSARSSEAMGLWDDVSGFTAIRAVDDTALAAASTTIVTNTTTFLGIPISSTSYWQNSLPNTWTRIAVGDIAGSNLLGVNKWYGANNNYHEIYIDVGTEGVSTFQLGSQAFQVLLHEIGHSVIGEHSNGGIMEDAISTTFGHRNGGWYSSTPMSADIDRAVAMYGAATTTRAGNDTYGFNAQFSGAYRAAFDFSANTRPFVTIYDNGGNDTLDASGFRAAGATVPVHIDLNPGHASRLLGGQGQTFAIIYQGAGPMTWIENAVGSAGGDIIIGNEANNNLYGGAGDDLLWGMGGSDLLNGGSGWDTALFADGLQSYWFRSIGTNAMVGKSEFIGKPIQSVDTLVDIEGLWFGEDPFSGETAGRIDGVNYLSAAFGTANNDTVTGTSGADIMFGFTGNDTYSVNSIYDIIVESDEPGVDTVLASLAEFTLPDKIENLTYVGTASHRGLGNDLNNQMIGGLSGDYIFSAAGDDTVDGGIGDDTLFGGAGADRVTGGTGNDYLGGENGNDTISGGDGNDLIESDEGFNSIDGGAGIDWLLENEAVARAGEVLPIGFEVDLAAGSIVKRYASGVVETDTVVNVENVAGLANSGSILRGSGVANRLDGGAAADQLSGRGGNDVLLGNAGDDLLDGGAGQDSMWGGQGNDIYIVGSSTDAVSEFAGEGIDEVRTGLGTHTLAADVEKLTYTGTANFSGTGNTGDNLLSGGVGADRLNGGAGNDTIAGGAGNDVLTGGTGLDRFVFKPGFGNDRIAEFDADPTGGQDLIELSGFGVTNSSFLQRVTVSDVGADALLTVDGLASQTIRLTGVGNASSITVDDFRFA